MRAAATTTSRIRRATSCCARSLSRSSGARCRTSPAAICTPATSHIDLAARSVEVAGRPVNLSRLEFELLVKFAGDPDRVFSKHELHRCIWHGEQISGRTVDSHVARLRTRLTHAGAEQVLANKWGQGWSLSTPH